MTENRNFWILETRRELDGDYQWLKVWNSDTPLPFRKVREQAVAFRGELDDDTRLRPATPVSSLFGVVMLESTTTLRCLSSRSNRMC